MIRFKDDQELKPGGKVSIDRDITKPKETTSSLVIDNVTGEDSGQYVAVFKNEAGEEKVTTNVKVQGQFSPKHLRNL